VLAAPPQVLWVTEPESTGNFQQRAISVQADKRLEAFHHPHYGIDGNQKDIAVVTSQGQCIGITFGR
jgi:hypothetical protein